MRLKWFSGRALSLGKIAIEPSGVAIEAVIHETVSFKARNVTGCSLTALTVDQVVMAEGQPLGVASSFEEERCVICKLGFQNDKATTVSEKGMMSLISFSEERGCLDLHSHLRVYQQDTYWKSFSTQKLPSRFY